MVGFVVFLLIIITLFILSICKYSVRMYVNLYEDKINLKLFGPLTKIDVDFEENTPVLKMRFLNAIKIRRVLKRGKKRRNNMLSVIEPQNTHVQVSYGFFDPAITGLFSAFLGVAGSRFPVSQSPYFVVDKEFINISAKTRISPLKALLALSH